MSHMARDTAVDPRLVARALAICFFAAGWLLLSQVAAEAGPRHDAGDRGVSEVAHDAVASTRAATDRGRESAEPVGEPVRDAAREAEDSVAEKVSQVEETGDRATEETVRTVEGVARDAGEATDGATDKVRDVVQEATRQVAEVVEEAPGPVAPAPEPEARGDAHRVAEERPAAADAVHESLVKLENPALLVVPTTPAVTLSEAASEALSSTAVEALGSPVPAPAPMPGVTPDGGLPVPGGSGQPVPTPAQAAYLGDAVPATDLDLVRGVLERALVPPAERATSPGTTPD